MHNAINTIRVTQNLKNAKILNFPAIYLSFPFKTSLLCIIRYPTLYFGEYTNIPLTRFSLSKCMFVGGLGHLNRPLFLSKHYSAGLYTNPHGFKRTKNYQWTMCLEEQFTGYFLTRHSKVLYGLCHHSVRMIEGGASKLS